MPRRHTREYVNPQGTDPNTPVVHEYDRTKPNQHQTQVARVMSVGASHEVYSVSCLCRWRSEPQVTEEQANQLAAIHARSEPWAPDLQTSAEDVIRSMVREHATAISVTVDGVAYDLYVRERTR